MGININNLGAINAYMHMNSSTPVKKTNSTTKSRNTDTVEFSSAAMEKLSESATESTNSARQAAADAVRSGASEARIAELRAAVKAGTYSVSSQQIADSILSF